MEYGIWNIICGWGYGIMKGGDLCVLDREARLSPLVLKWNWSKSISLSFFSRLSRKEIRSLMISQSQAAYTVKPER